MIHVVLCGGPGLGASVQGLRGVVRTISRRMTTFQPVVLSGPSGSGKSTLLKKLMAEYKDCFAFSVSRELYLTGVLSSVLGLLRSIMSLSNLFFQILNPCPLRTLCETVEYFL